MPLSDQEILCEFMEPRPKLRKNGQLPINSPLRSLADLKWWYHRAMTFPFLFPVNLSLNECHLIEERLTEERIDYVSLLAGDSIQGEDCESIDWLDGLWAVAHADAPAKIKALAEVLRPVVEGRRG